MSDFSVYKKKKKRAGVATVQTGKVVVVKSVSKTAVNERFEGSPGLF